MIGPLCYRGSRLLRWAALLFSLAAAGSVAAHELSLAEMELRETAPGQFLWQWTASNGNAGQDQRPQWPAGCQADGNRLRCADGRLQGRQAVEGVGQRCSAALVKVFWLDGQQRVYTLTSAQPTVQLYGARSPALYGMGGVAALVA